MSAHDCTKKVKPVSSFFMRRCVRLKFIFLEMYDDKVAIYGNLFCVCIQITRVQVNENYA